MDKKEVEGMEGRLAEMGWKATPVHIYETIDLGLEW